MKSQFQQEHQGFFFQNSNENGEQGSADGENPQGDPKPTTDPPTVVIKPTPEPQKNPKLLQ